MLDCEQIKEIINKIDGSSLRVFELEDKDVKLKLSKNSDGNNSANNESNNESRIAREEVASTEAVAYSEPEVENEKVAEKEEFTNLDADLKSIKSPLVGTYYSSATPDSTPYVTVGSKVKKGDTLCIIEAMKVMNEVTSEYDGEVMAVLKKDEDIVEYGMDLFKIKEI